ncbi:MAG: hypothetical protein ACXAC5_02995 [Promethearchaeota archaeon]|jgi:hypothetical protein
MTKTTPKNPHKFVGYMCGTEFFYEEGRPSPKGNQIFAKASMAKEAHPFCERECGIVKVEVKFVEWELPPSGPMEGENIDGEQIEWERGH